LEKLLAHANFRRPICVEDIQALVSEKQLSSVFELVDAIGMRQADTAMRALHELLDAGAAPLYLLHMIERQFRILLQVKDMHSRGAGLSEIQSELGIRHTFIVKKALNQARRFSPQRLEAIFVHLAGIEQEIKTGKVADLLALDLLVAEVSLGDA
jgi:DNA polymerase-3 subunit delta